MFQSARLKLTGWYLAIIMLISILFSIGMYASINREFDRFERFQRIRQERLEFGRIIIPQDRTMVAEARSRLILTFIFINMGILGFSGAAGYFLAGRTLRPIQKMVDEQNRFITDSSHELRTPLTSLRSEIEVSLRDKKLTFTDAKNLLESNLEEVINLQILSDSLIWLTKYGKPQEKSYLDVSFLELMNDACKKIAPQAAKKHITFKKNMSNVILFGEKQSLVELFVILLDNAVKYSSKKTVITIISSQEDHSMSVSIRDQGIGILDKDIPHIFDRFYRVDKARSKETAGYGLGLSIAKKIVEAHDGSIVVKSEVGKGSEFIVALPFKQIFS